MNTVASQKFHGLDALRGILAALVCFAHAIQVFIGPLSDEPTTLQFVMGLLARLSVVWFFCLSGYVIALSIGRNIERNGRFFFWKFGQSRLWRIAPALLFVVVFVVLLSKIAVIFGFDSLPDGVRGARSHYAIELKNQLLALVSVGAIGELPGRLNGPLWSLQYELQLYVISGLAALAYFSGASALKRIAAVILVAVYLKYAFHLRSLNGEYSHQLLWYATFFTGSIGYAVFRRITTRFLLVAAVVAMAAAAYIVFQFSMAQFIGEASTSATLMAAQFLAAISFTALIIVVTRMPVAASTGSVGDFGYTLYIVHFPILLFGYFYLVNHATYSVPIAWLSVVIGVVATILLSRWLSKTIENPKRLRYLAHRMMAVFRPNADVPLTD